MSQPPMYSDCSYTLYLYNDNNSSLNLLILIYICQCELSTHISKEECDLKQKVVMYSSKM